MRLHPEGYRSVGVSFTLALLLFLVQSLELVPHLMGIFAYFFLFMSFAFLSFYRDPERSSDEDANTLVAAADGKVILIQEHSYCEELKGPARQISVFMSPLNVHVNRCAISGTIRKVDYRPGEYLVAYHEKASEKNEACLVSIEDERGRSVALRQIAGLLARRIRWQVKEGDRVERSSRYGVIKLGSRLDHFFPLEVQLRVKIGDRVKAGKTTMGVWK
jgi:phosphatidylserine decarboxylase